MPLTVATALHTKHKYVACKKKIATIFYKTCAISIIQATHCKQELIIWEGTFDASTASFNAWTHKGHEISHWYMVYSSV